MSVSKRCQILSFNTQFYLLVHYIHISQGMHYIYNLNSLYGDREIQHCQRCHFQFAIDVSSFLHSPNESWRDQNTELIWMSDIDHCHLGQVLTPPEHVSSHLQFVRGIQFFFSIQETYCTYILSPTLQRSASTASWIFTMQYFDFEAVLTEGYSRSIIKALYREESTQCLSIHLPCLPLTFSQPRACIDSLFPSPPHLLR